MKTTYLIATAVIGLALAAPLAAHHNSPFELEIGDMMDQHEYAIENLNLPDSATGAMDPSNMADPPSDSSGSMPDDLDPQSNGTGIPDGDFEPGAGADNGGSTEGQPW